MLQKNPSQTPGHPRRNLQQLYARALSVDDAEKISAANYKANMEANVNEGEPVKKLRTVQCVEVHIQQNKMEITNFLKQTTDKIYPVVSYLRDKIFIPSGTPEYFRQ